MKECPKCGNINNDEARFCNKCGREIILHGNMDKTLSSLNNMSTGDEILKSINSEISAQLAIHRSQYNELHEIMKQTYSKYEPFVLKTNKDERELWDIIYKLEDSLLSLQDTQTVTSMLYITIIRAIYQNLNYTDFKFAVDKILTENAPLFQERVDNATKMVLTALNMLRFKYLSIFDR